MCKQYISVSTVAGRQAALRGFPTRPRRGVARRRHHAPRESQGTSRDDPVPSTTQRHRPTTNSTNGKYTTTAHRGTSHLFKTCVSSCGFLNMLWISAISLNRWFDTVPVLQSLIYRGCGCEQNLKNVPILKSFWMYMAISRQYRLTHTNNQLVWWHLTRSTLWQLQEYCFCRNIALAGILLLQEYCSYRNIVIAGILFLQECWYCRNVALVGILIL